MDVDLSNISVIPPECSSLVDALFKDITPETSVLALEERVVKLERLFGADIVRRALIVHLGTALLNLRKEAENDD